MARQHFIIAAAILIYAADAFSWYTTFPAYEAYIDYLTSHDHPENLNKDWTDNVQGITNDGTHWYLTQETKLIRVPESANLADNLYQYGYTTLSNWTGLIGYNHFGDISFYDPDPDDGQAGYILVPVDQGSPSNALLALFRANASLAFVGADYLQAQGINAGWVAVGADGAVYSSDNEISEIRKYQVNWDEVQLGHAVKVSYDHSLQLLDSDGTPMDAYPQKLTRLQGGVISPSGSVLFLSNGFYDPESGDESWGIHAYTLGSVSCTRIARSCKDGSQCLFHYEFHPENTYGEEPEGLTIWDQDFGGAPNIDGQLHILMARQNWPSDDEVYLKHYTVRQFLSPAGDIQSVHDSAWSGSIMSFTPGSYSQSVVFDKKVLLEAPSGSAIIFGQ